MNIFKLLFFTAALLASFMASGQIKGMPEPGTEKNREEIQRLMKEGAIPGVNIVFIKDTSFILKSFGYANVAGKVPVKPETLFEIGRCGESFTALSVLKLASAGAISLNKSISDYLPWFSAKYKQKAVTVTVEQLLHHTSGITSDIVSQNNKITTADEASGWLKSSPGIKLNNLPGTVYKHSSLNYDILMLLIEAVKNKAYPDYLRENILDTLHLFNTTIGKPINTELMSAGYKNGFFGPEYFNAPAYTGTSLTPPVITNAPDLAKWVIFQLGKTDSAMFTFAKQTQNRDEKVPLHNMLAYGMGWEVSLNGDGKIFNEGVSPNYSTYIGFLPETKEGVIVLANSNSKYTSLIGEKCLSILSGKSEAKQSPAEEDSGAFYSMMGIVLALFVLVQFAFIGNIFYNIKKGNRRYAGFSGAVARKLILVSAVLLPLLFGIYIYPYASEGLTWRNMLIWSPGSFLSVTILAIVAIGMCFVAYGMNLCFPHKSKIRQLLPLVLVLSIFSGIANVAVITLVSNSFNTKTEPLYLVFYYILAAAVYVLGRRFVQRSLTKFSMGMIYDLRVEIIDKIFSTSYQNFELLDRGRVYTSLNNDILRLGEIAHTAVVFTGGVFTIVGGFTYLALISFWSTTVVVLVFIIIALIYYFVIQSTDKYFHRSRDSENIFMRCINGMLDGFKELSMHRQKKTEFKNDIGSAASDFKENRTIANVRYIDVFIIGESLITLVLGIVVFVLPYFFQDIQAGQIMSFVIILLYLITPIDNVLNSIPGIMQLKIAKKRIDQFLKEIPANLVQEKGFGDVKLRKVESIRAEKVTYKYKGNSEASPFSIGPIDLEVKAGEIVFIVGGNGSGKTTFSKLLTGLYMPDSGGFFINDKPVSHGELGEYFSASFSPAFLFEKLYSVDVQNKQQEINEYLELLGLDQKVKITGNKYNSIKLSGGQLKRLALFQCYLEDSPIYLFDEWAADQDPGYRNFFYRTLLPEMKLKGKIVIAITHDDHYFDVADKVLKMKMGRLEMVEVESLADLI